MKSELLRHRLMVVTFGALATLTACGSGNGNNDAICTAEVRSSILLTVLDTFGLPLRGYSVAYQIDKGTIQNVSCEGSDACSIAYEKSGLFSMTISKPGFNATSLEVAVTRDVCHVATQNTTVTLKAF